MPNNKTQHWTDGTGIGEKLTGPKLTKRLEELAENANSHHQEAEEAWQGWLEHARQAGEALLEAKRRCGHRSKWAKWRYRNFCGSKETSCHYMRVAREWENPGIADARESGVTVDSINKFLKLLRGQPLKAKPKEKSPSEKKQAELREALRNEFALRIKELNVLELEILADRNWQGMHFFNSLWDTIHERLKTAVAVVYGDIDDDPREQSPAIPDRPGRLKATDALNGPRKT